jgi:hypothetical protein
MRNAISKLRTRTCKRCNKKIKEDIICASCKNELLSQYDSRISWKTAYDIEKVSRYVMRNTLRYDSDEPTTAF